MSRELLLNVEAPSSLQTPTAMSDNTENMSIDQDGEWDISLFDELEGLGDADELLQALSNAGYTASAADLNLDMDLPVWSSDMWTDSSSMCTDGDISTDSLSPAHTLISVSSPTSTEAHSPCSLLDEALSPLSIHSQPSPLSVCSDSSGSVEPPPAKKPVKKTNQIKAKPVMRPIPLSPKVSIQPKPLITALPITQTAALPTKTIIIQPVQATIVPVVKPAPVTIQPAPPAGHPTLLSQPTSLLQLQPPQVVPAATRVLTLPSMAQDRVTNPASPAIPSPVIGIPLRNPPSDEDFSVSRRQQRMIKNRESASLSRKKKKEYLLTLEARLKVALCENEKLKNENGTLKRQLEGLMSENTILKATAPKRRAVCLMVVLVFLAINIVPMSLFKRDADSRFAAHSPSSRHLLGFSSNINNNMEASVQDSLSSNKLDDLESMPEEKALMVVKRDPLFFRAPPPPPCQPPVNRTKCIKMASELRGWVHRHETERTKSQRNSSTHSRARTITKMGSKKAEVPQIVTVQYPDSNDKHSGNELQVYYAPHHTYGNFFDELNRRGDTFYVISFRRDHLLLPATNHNRGSRPKMSVVLPAMNINESVIKDKEFEVMMQIDCEVMDTRILHIKSSSIPPILRVNESDAESFYHSAPSNNPASPTVGVLVGSA
ncbi:cyclic AMP-dependent transcription factor ATF-6 alpha isoform X2 [Hemibagrus wyckioides]|uniref:cyclic AMP-dependent transcription factor ATF-6 alpha isoform X2 n=1 Tax=Hemibagrus wyckioides TaxID=337641 RepID=UPI00266CA0B3|nr:cyclic AMP-dependent transcription factor ATF-6 alpha isoform X2 [Hemibagrus wyckioides]